MNNLIIQSERTYQIIHDDDSIGRVVVVDDGSSNNNQSRNSTIDDAVVDICCLGNNNCTANDNDDDGNMNGDRVLLTQNGQLIRYNNYHNEQQQVLWSCNLNSVVNGKDESWFSVSAILSSSSSIATTIITENNQQEHHQQQHQVLLLVCMNHTNGAIVTVDARNGYMELVGEFENGILAGTWNPTKEILALITSVTNDDNDDNNSNNNTKSNVLLLMNTQFEVLDEIPIETIDNNSKVSICWNTTGTYLAISSVDNSITSENNNNNTKRKVRIYHIRAGTSNEEQQPSTNQLTDSSTSSSLIHLVSVGRNEDGSGTLVPNILSPCLAWAGIGTSNLLATVQKKGLKTIQIIFFETNGLRHGQFTLRTNLAVSADDIEIIQLGWNPIYTDLLCITINEKITQITKVQLWYRSNYYWYCKQEIQFASSSSTSTSVTPTTTMMVGSSVQTTKFVGKNHLIVLCTNGKWIEYKFKWNHTTTNINSCSTMLQHHHHQQQQQNNQSCTCVIDGCNLHITNYQSAIIPPPMYGTNIVCKSSIQEIVVVNTTTTAITTTINNEDNNNSNLTNNIVAAVLLLSDGTIGILGYNNSHNKNTHKTIGYPSLLAISTIPLTNTISDNSITNDIGSGSSSIVDALASSLQPLRHPVIVQSTSSSVRMIGCMSLNSDFMSDILVDIILCWDDTINANTTTTTSGAEIKIKSISSKLLEGRVLTISPWYRYNTSNTTTLTKGTALIQLEDGILLEYETIDYDDFDITDDKKSSFIIQPPSVEQLLEPCLWISAITDEHKVCADDSDIRHDHHGGRGSSNTLVIGMSSSNRLYCRGDVLIADAVSSYVVCFEYDYLCYVTTADMTAMTSSSTTTSHSGKHNVMRFVSLNELMYHLDPYQGSEEISTILNGYEPRKVERGSKIVAVGSSSNQPAAILQIPRGNLEVIYPRALILRFAMLSVLQENYKIAFEMMRKHKVDLNLLVDMDPIHFIKDSTIETFIEQITDIDHLNLFISCLQNYNCCSEQNRYPKPRWLQQNGEVKETTEAAQPESNSSPSSFNFLAKTNVVCQKLRTVMMKKEEQNNCQQRASTANHVDRPARAVKKEGHYLLPILSTFAKEHPPQLGQALELIRVFALSRCRNLTNDHGKSSNNKSKSKSPLFSEFAQSAIQYLAFLADYELLFETALGTYDYEMARAVARHSQMDPKIYLPLIRRYQNYLPDFYGRYEVDIRLKRYESALRNLYQSGLEGETTMSRNEVDDDCRRSASNTIEDQQRDSNEASTIQNDFASCMSLIEKHSLHRVGLELTQSDSEQQRQIMTSLGDYLSDQKKQPSAALSVYMATDPVDRDRALRAAREAKDWVAFFSLWPCTPDTGLDDKGNPLPSATSVARQIAEEIAASADSNFLQKQELLCNAARVLLDYTDDITGAVEYLIRAEAWKEGKRICALMSRNDLLKKLVDAAVSYAYTAIADLDERAEAFVENYARYIEVLSIRKEAIASGEADPGEFYEDMDDSGSLFSLASNTSNTSMRSATSTGSVGSLSSVISVKSTNSFTIAGTEASLRHKSKYNQIGRKQKKKKQGKGRSKARPGSEQELQGLVQTLTNLCVEELYCNTVGDTITFLIRNQNVQLARELFHKYIWFCSTIEATHQHNQKVKFAANEKGSSGLVASEQLGISSKLIVHSVEKVVENLFCPMFPESMRDLVSYFPHSVNDN